MKNNTYQNNVTRLLKSRNITYRVHCYDYAAGIHSAVEVANAIGLPAERVFKSLVVMGDKPEGKPLLLLIPGPDMLDLKKTAKAVGQKKVKMASHEQAESLTGLQTGGISPLALIKKGFAFYIDKRAADYSTISLSAGQRGVNIELSPSDLIKTVRARLIDLGSASFCP